MAEGCSVMVFMIKGMNSATSWCTLGLYSWYISTTMMGSSASTLRDSMPRGMMLYWKKNQSIEALIDSGVICPEKKWPWDTFRWPVIFLQIIKDRMWASSIAKICFTFYSSLFSNKISSMQTLTNYHNILKKKYKGT